MDLGLDLESFVRDLDLSDLQHLLAQDSSGDEDEDLDLESHFPTATQVEVEENVVDISPQQGAPGSSVGRASDSGSRSPGFETHAGHLVMGLNST